MITQDDYQWLFRKAPVMATSIAEDGVYLDVNDTMLERLGYQVLATSSPDAAVDLAERHPGEIELLLTDVVMPGFSGKDLSEKVLRIRPDIRVLYMSGYTANVIAHHGVLESGINFLQKPFRPQELARRVRRILDAELPQTG